MTHDEVKELIPAYALDAVGSMERGQIDDHLETCDQCRTSLRDHREAAGLLAFTTDPAIPTKGLRTRLMKGLSAADNGASQARAKAAKTPAPRRGLVLVVAAILGVIIAAIAIFVRGGTAPPQEVTPEMRRLLAAESLSSEPLLPTRELPEASGQVFRVQDGNSIVVAFTGLKDPGERVYMLWAVVERRPVRLGKIEIDGQGSALLHLIKSLPEDNDGLLLTLEDSAEARTVEGPVILESPQVATLR